MQGTGSAYSVSLIWGREKVLFRWLSRRRAQVFGWWDFDQNTQTMVNRVTGQRLTEHPRDGGDRRRFTYSDSETAYDIHARFLSPRRSHGERWTFNYNTSCDLQPDHKWHIRGRPRDGLWKRMDECLCDALLAWPNEENQTRAGTWFDLVGGWLNGSWQTDWARTWRCGHLTAYELPKRSDISFTPVSLQASPPPRWSYVHSPVAAPNPEIPGLSIERERMEVSLPESPGGIRVGSRMPHLLREDGKAVIVPLSMRGTGSYGNAFSINVHILYADDELACLPYYSTFSDDMNIMLPRVAYRKTRPHKTLLPVLKPYKIKWKTPDAQGKRVSKGISKLMSYETWRRLDIAMLDGFSCWNPPHRVVIPASESERHIFAELRGMLELPSAEEAGFDLDRLRNISLSGRYVGGMPFSTGPTCHFRWTATDS